jgi:carbon-monoxide dehydrogenase large subunit
MAELASTGWIGKSAKRREDLRLITGKGNYVTDINLPGMLHMVVLRSRHAHAKIRAIRTDRALQAPGVKAILTGEDVVRMMNPMPTIIEMQGFVPIRYYSLAVDRVRYVGEPVVALVAESRYAAEDALEQIEVDYDPLPVVADAEKALLPSAPKLYDDRPDNVIFHFTHKVGDVNEAFREADVVVRERFTNARATATPIECRSCVAEYNQHTGILTLWIGTQRPHVVRDVVAKILGLPEARLRVIAPDCGGGFGVKAGFYPEDSVAGVLATTIGRPVKWWEDRLEHMVATSHGREQIHEMEAGFKKDGTLVGVRDRVIADVGAANLIPYFGFVPVFLGALLLPNTYKVPALDLEVNAVLTNKTPKGAVRGFGVPANVFSIERVMDIAARKLGMDPSDLRRKNMFQPNEFPATNAMQVVYNSGSFVESLDRVLELGKYQEIRREADRLRKEGRFVGVGIGTEVEIGAPNSQVLGLLGFQMGGYDSAVIRIYPSGKVGIFTGAPAHGQGHETTWAMVAADVLGVPIEDITVMQGDTLLCPYSSGTFGSRTSVAVVGAIIKGAEKVREKILRIAGHLLEASPDDLQIAEGKITVKGVPQKTLTLKEVAEAAYVKAYRLPRDIDPGLEITQYFEPAGLATVGNLAHLAMVEVDPETGGFQVLRYHMVGDCGTMINPMLVEGQAHGSIAHGYGFGVLEELVYDENGQLQNGTFMDYLLPTALDVPKIEVNHLVTPDPMTVIGTKGMGEGNGNVTPAVLANAIEDALSPLGVKITALPLKPSAIRAAIDRARAQSSDVHAT